MVWGWEVWGTPEAWSHSKINLHWAQAFAHAHWLALGFMRPLADALNKKNRSQRAIYSCCSLRFPSLPSALLLLTIWHSYTLMFFLPCALHPCFIPISFIDSPERQLDPSQIRQIRGTVDPKKFPSCCSKPFFFKTNVSVYSVCSRKVVLNLVDFHCVGQKVLKISSFMFRRRQKVLQVWKNKWVNDDWNYSSHHLGF